MNKLFFVFGPESAGNHVTSKILQTMGCFWEEPQKLDKFVYGEINNFTDITTQENIVLRRSVPHGRDWCDPLAIKIKFLNHQPSYEMITIIPVRDWMPNILSNYYHRATTQQEAIPILQKAWTHIGKHMINIMPFYFLNTSLLFKYPKSTIESLEFFTGLKWPNENYNQIYDADIGKHKIFQEYGFENINREIIRDNIKH